MKLKYIKRDLFLFLLFMLIFLSNALAATEMMSYPLNGEIEVTSPYGWRTHPIFGTEIFHSGIDFGADEGQEVYAAADGIVNYVGWISGYGNTVIIDHGNGLQTLYGHNSALIALQGQNIMKGEEIALAGSTGNSTGPHCHFEVDLDGEPVDPAQYLDGTLPDTSPTGFFNSDYNFIPIDFDASVDFAKPLRDAADTFAEHSTSGLGLIKDKAKWLFLALMTIDFALSLFWIGFHDDFPALHWFTSRSIYFGFLFFMLLHWGDGVANIIRGFFVSMGGSIVDTPVDELGKIVSDPTYIMQKGMQIISPLFTFAGTFSGPAFLYNLSTIIMSLFFALLLMLCFAMVSYQVVLAYIEFYVIALFSFVSFSFAGLKQGRKYAGYGVNALFAISVKLMFFCVFSVLLTTTLQNLTVQDFFSMGGIESKTNSTNGKDLSAANSASTIDQFMAAIREVETGGSDDPYHTPSSDGEGYGAYQISYTNWNSWCEQAGLNVPSDWTPENQDAVAKHKMLEYYSEYGNWHDVAVCWNGGGGAVGAGWSSTEGYAAKVEAALGHPLQKTLNMILLLSMLIICVLFLWFASRMTEVIMQFFGGAGFHFHIEQDEEI